VLLADQVILYKLFCTGVRITWVIGEKAANKQAKRTAENSKSRHVCPLLLVS